MCSILIFRFFFTWHGTRVAICILEMKGQSCFCFASWSNMNRISMSWNVIWIEWRRCYHLYINHLVPWYDLSDKSGDIMFVNGFIFFLAFWSCLLGEKFTDERLEISSLFFWRCAWLEVVCIANWFPWDLTEVTPDNWVFHEIGQPWKCSENLIRWH